MKVEQRRTLAQVFESPAPTDIPWADIESMLRSAGVNIKERSGSLVALVKDGEVMVLRRPHPKPLAMGATVRDIAAYLKAVGVEP